jgi:hypothetical protein
MFIGGVSFKRVEAELKPHIEDIDLSETRGLERYDHPAVGTVKVFVGSRSAPAKSARNLAQRFGHKQHRGNKKEGLVASSTRSATRVYACAP